ncbi:MAG: DUF917 domain-containing protein [Treponema sp.]|jgi:DUF917 family protein|nr:DUF917 domain-containing protein [Treponema sp.]
MRLLHEQNVEKIALGAAVLGSGGGGDPYLGKLMAIQAIKEHGPVKLIDVYELSDNDLVFPSAAMGAPVVMLEKIPNGEEPKKAIAALENYLGKKATAIIPIEAGGLNSCIPIYTAACLGLPLVDGDGMGRAFPELMMVSYGIGGKNASPMVVCDEKGNMVILESINNQWAETLARSVTVAMGLFTQMSIYVMSGADVKQFAIKNTMSLAEKIGGCLVSQSDASINPVDKIIKTTNACRLFEGKVVDVRRDLATGFIRGHAKFEGIRTYTGQIFSIDFQNENLVATRNANAVAMTPDLITLLDIEKGLPVQTDTLKYGQRLAAIGIPCDKFWKTEEALKVTGPRYFKYDFDYIPIEELEKQNGGIR